MKKIVKYLVGIIAIALVYLLISNFNLIMYKIAIYQQVIVEKISELTEKENNKGKKLSEIIFGDKYESTDIENLSDKELRATRFVDGWTDEEVERIIKEWEKKRIIII